MQSLSCLHSYFHTLFRLNDWTNMLMTDLQEHWNNVFWVFLFVFFLKWFNNPHQKLDSVNLMGLIVCLGQPFGIHAHSLSGEETDWYPRSQFG